MRAELAYDARAVLGECPLWNPRENRLYWVDIDPGAIHVFDPASGADRATTLGWMIGCIAFCASGRLLAAGAGGLFELDSLEHPARLISNPIAGDPQLRFNDGKVDPKGRFWAGTYHMLRVPQRAALYCLEADRSLRTVLIGLSNSNGLGWSPDATVFYHIDTPTLEVSAFDFDADTGQISGRRCVVRFSGDDGRPDGMAVDAEGRLWIAHFDGGRVSCWDPRSGRRQEVVELPCSRVTSCAFGGAKLDELFITTARKGLDESRLRDEPLAGGLFVVRPGVQGLPGFYFRD